VAQLLLRLNFNEFFHAVQTRGPSRAP